MSSKLKELKPLFTSEARVRVLARLALHTADRFYQSELAALERLPIKAVQRELGKLLRFGLVRRAGTAGRQKYYQVNREHPLYPELKAIILKTIVVGTQPERLKKLPLAKVKVAFVFGSLAKADEDRQSDIDIMVVGGISSSEWSDFIRDSRLLEFREENSIVMPEEEFKRRLDGHEEFLTKVVAGPKIFLKGGDDDLKRLAQGPPDPKPEANS